MPSRARALARNAAGGFADAKTRLTAVRWS